MVLLLFVPCQQPGTPAPQEAEIEAEAEEARAVAKKLAGEYVFDLDKLSGKKLKLEPEPVLRWLLQLDRRFYSDVYVWTHEGRPLVVAAITNVYGPRRVMETEIHSLSTELPRLLHHEKVVWAPERPGVEWKPIPGAAKPDTTAVARLKQMRNLAAEYSVVVQYGKMKEEMRLLPTPIYRYASEKQGVTDGALFAFARGTDPEAFLLIEARQERKGVAWQYALVRFVGHASLQANRDDRQVWTADGLAIQVITDPKEPYCGLRKYSDFPVVK
jgi:hypothetical protein